MNKFPIMDLKCNMYIKSIFYLFCSALVFTSIQRGFSLDKDRKEVGNAIHYSSTSVQNPILWGKPLDKGTIKILAITPRYCSFDFFELEKRLDCLIQLITAEDSLHLGCDPHWGVWCPEEFQSDTIIQKIRDGIKKKWDLIIIAGIQLDILPKEIYESIINKIAGGSSLLIIPASSDTLSPPHPIEDFVESLEVLHEPSERWLHLFSGGNSVIRTEMKNTISVNCSDYEHGRIVYLKNYLTGVLNHALLPEQAVTGEMTYLENAWAGIISLILWCARVSESCRILDISDAKPSGPVEEEIPPELPMMVIRNLNQSLLGPGTYPFYIELSKKDKQKIDEIKIQIRRENEYFSYQQYEFKPNIDKQENTFIQVELPIGAGNYFLDVWLIRKGKIVDYFSKRFTFTSWPEILSIEPNKKFVYPNDSITLKVNVLPDIMENREGTIIVQGIDNYSYIPSIEGNLVCEQSKPITGKGGETSIILNFADLMGNYLKINVWGAPTHVNYLGVHYSPLFSYKSLFIPIQRKIFQKEWKDFIQLSDIREYNQLQIAQFFMEHLNCGNYLSIEKYHLHGVTKLYQPFIVQITEETTRSALHQNLREPCINDENYLNRKKEEVTQIVTQNIIPTPYTISLGLNNCLVQTEEWVCFCEHCINKFREAIHLGEYLGVVPELIEKFESTEIDNLKKEISNRNFSSYLFFYKKFMENSFINFEVNLKNKLKTFFPDTSIGFRYYNKDSNTKCVDWIETINSMDWVVLEPDPFVYSLIPYIKSQNKSFWVSLDFGNPQIKPEEIAWHYWNAILNQANGVWFLNINGDINRSQPIKLFTEQGVGTPELNTIIQINKQLQGGLKDLFLQLKPDHNEEVGIYCSPENLFLTSDYPEFSHKNSFTNFMRLINGFGINPIIITKETILSSKKLKVLVLPCCLWLSEEEIENLSEFLDRGIIMADISPGIISDNDLIMNLMTILNEQNTHKNSMKNKNIYLLNKSLTKSFEIQPIEEIKEEISFIQNILRERGIKSLFLNENDWIDGKFYSFNKGTIIAWQPSLNPVKINKNTQISINLIKNKKVSDLIKEKNIRNIKKIKSNINQKIPLIISCQKDYKLKIIDIESPQTVKRGNRIPVRFKIIGGEKEKSDIWLYVELKTNKNQQKILFSQIYNSQTGKEEEIFIPVPNNIGKGWYNITVKEIITGVKIEKQIKIY